MTEISERKDLWIVVPVGELTGALVAAWARDVGSAVVLAVHAPGWDEDRAARALSAALRAGGIPADGVRSIVVVGEWNLTRELELTERCLAVCATAQPRGLLQTLPVVAPDELGAVARHTIGAVGARRGRAQWHRRWVGGLWEEIGALQFSFLRDQGLRPGDVLVDIGCGSLRAGRHMIPFLDPGHYLGLDADGELLRHGIALELGLDLYRRRRPEFVVSSTFEFGRFATRASYGLCHSLFTHLTVADIELCLRRLRAWVPDGHRLFATFLEGDGSASNPPRSDALRAFVYPCADLARLAHATGWCMTYVGAWGHPRGQLMLRFEPA